MSALRLPPHWRGMGFTAKAGWLTGSGQARDYSHACSILAGMRNRKPKPPVARQAIEKRWDLNY